MIESMSRRRLAFALGMAVLLLILALFAACSGGSESGAVGADSADGSVPVDVASVTTAPASPTPLTPASQPPPPRGATPEPTPTDTMPPPVATPAFTGPPLTLVAQGLSRRHVEAGEPLDTQTGLFIADTASGGGDLWTLAPKLAPEGSFALDYSATLDSRFLRVRVLGHDRNASYLTDSETGETFELAASTISFTSLKTPSGHLLFKTSACAFAIVKLHERSAETVSTFEPPGGGGCGSVRALFSDDGERLLILSRGTGSLSLVDVETGAATLVVRGLGSANALVRQGEQVLVTSVSGGKYGPARITLRRYTWDGEMEGETMIDAGSSSRVDHLTVSPDGSSVAWQGRLPLAVPGGLGGREHWPVVTVADARSGEVRFRAVRASLTNGMRTLEWLSDGSALVIATPAGFALLSATTGVIEPLPFGPVDHFAPIPIPAPDDPSLFAYDGRVVNALGEVVRPVSPPAIEWGERWWVDATYRWGATSEQLQFTRFEPGGKDLGPGGLSSLGLPARVEFPPFADEVRLRVTADGPASLYESAEGASPLLGEVPSGAPLIVVNLVDDSATRDLCHPNPECSTTYDRVLPYDEGWWLHVRTEDGIEGWVRSNFLEWAD